MSTLTKTPASNDAVIRSGGTGALIDVMRTSGTKSVISGTATTGGTYIDNKNDFTNAYCDRLILPFDTSALGSGATITAATLTVQCAATGAAGFVSPPSPTLSLVAITLASPPTVAASDYAGVTFTKLATDVTISTTGSKVFTLNSAGLAAINKTGYTVLALIDANDFADSISSPDTIPTGGYRYTTFNLSENATAKPTLDITYSTTTAATIPTNAGASSSSGSLTLTTPSPVTIPTNTGASTTSASLSLIAPTPATIPAQAASSTSSGSLSLATSSAVGVRAAPGWLGTFITDTGGSPIPTVSGQGASTTSGALALITPSRQPISGAGQSRSSGSLSLRVTMHVLTRPTTVDLAPSTRTVNLRDTTKTVDLVIESPLP